MLITIRFLWTMSNISAGWWMFTVLPWQLQRFESRHIPIVRNDGIRMMWEASGRLYKSPSPWRDERKQHPDHQTLWTFYWSRRCTCNTIIDSNITRIYQLCIQFKVIHYCVYDISLKNSVNNGSHGIVKVCKICFCW